MLNRLLGFWVFFLASVSGASSLPGNLSASDIDRLSKLISMGGAVRALRPADSMPLWPGIKVGFEITLFPGDRFVNLGNQQATVSGTLPMPRIYIAKGLFEGVELIGSFFPFSLNTVNGGGLIAKWTFFTEKDHWCALAGLVGITSVTAFTTEFQGANLEFGAIVSKDYVRVKPYAGGSFMFARGKVSSALTSGPTETGALLGTHFYVGTEFELPVDLAVQIDLVNLDPTASAFVGKKF